jgi:hypothetical protein
LFDIELLDIFEFIALLFDLFAIFEFIALLLATFEFIALLFIEPLFDVFEFIELLFIEPLFIEPLFEFIDEFIFEFIALVFVLFAFVLVFESPPQAKPNAATAKSADKAKVFFIGKNSPVCFKG